jgi:hypothetical protein
MRFAAPTPVTSAVAPMVSHISASFWAIAPIVPQTRSGWENGSCREHPSPVARRACGVTKGSAHLKGARRFSVIDRNAVHEGTVVRASDGTKLGQVLASEEESFTVEEFLFGAVYDVRYDDVTEISGDEIRLSLPRDSSASEPWKPAEEEEEEEGAHSWVRGHEYPGALPPSYGDEGGGGFL